MACLPDFVQYIIDQCSGAGEIAVKKMMGDYCAYCDGILFGLICDNNFYVKVTDQHEVSRRCCKAESGGAGYGSVRCGN